MSGEATRFGASCIQMLQGRDAVRKRPGMYIGSTGERGLRQMVFELAGRAVNEVLGGRATRVDVTLTPDGGVRVTDDGPGVPLDAPGAPGGTGLEALLTQMQAGAGAGGRHEVTFAFSRLGPAVVNALSRRMTAEVRRGGVRWVQEYARGVAATPLTEAGTAADSGTTLAFWPDAALFDAAATFSFNALEERFRELALLNRGLQMTLTDLRRPEEPRSVQLCFPGGVGGFVDVLDGHAAASAPMDPISFACEAPRMAGVMEVAFRWCRCPGERVRSFANSRATVDGTHEAGLRDGLTAAVTAYARQHGLQTATDPGIGADRIGEGLTAVVSVKLDRPEFRGATRSVLANGDVGDCVGQAVQDHLGRWLRGTPERAATVIGRIVQGARRH
ncbi:DNA gyrase subunit B [Streptomyces sp. NPDC039022]|uniref:DNA gyrase subunit B n=1 Tax=unclassified Streptomyces TaxID=2593676 RepID=UPI003402CA9C